MRTEGTQTDQTLDEPSDVSISSDIGTNNKSSVEPSTELIEVSNRALVVREDSLWRNLDKLKKTNTLEARLARRDTYVELADHYEKYGGKDAAERFLKNALEQADDPYLRRNLARLQGQIQGYDFIVTFSNLLKDNEFDIGMTLEFCYFLECRNLHDAAINTLEQELKKRLLLSTQPDPSEAASIAGFFDLLMARIDSETSVRIKDYQQLFAVSFPKEVIESVTANDYIPTETIIGQELEEFESEYGLKDELRHHYQLLVFFAEHYSVHVAIVAAISILIGSAIARVSPKIIEDMGTTFFLLLLSFLSFELIRSLRLTKTFRSRARIRIANNAIAASFPMLMLNWLGSKVLGNGAHFFWPICVKGMSTVLVMALLGRAFLSLAAIRLVLKDIGDEVLRAIGRRTFRRNLSSLVAGTSQWSLLLSWVLILQLLTHSPATVALFAAVQTIFLASCWRWAYLEAKAEKLRLRESLIYVILLAFIALIVLEIYDGTPPITIVISLSMDSCLLLAISVTFALQIASIGKIALGVFTTCFVLLNFAPHLSKLIDTSQFGVFFGDTSAASFSLFAKGADVVLLATLVFLVRKAKLIRHQEVYMDAKYKILGGQQAAVGDHAHATNFTQTWNANASDINLSDLARELGSLRVALAPQAKEPSHFASLGDAAAAEQAAKAGDGPTTLEALKKVGTWFWDAATKIGIGVTTAAAKQALGL